MTLEEHHVDAILRRLFPSEHHASVRAMLGAYGEASHEREPTRVRVACLKVSNGDVSRLKRAIATARIDYRDVLSWAEYPEEIAGATWGMPPDEKTRVRDADRSQYEAWLRSLLEDRPDGSR